MTTIGFVRHGVTTWNKEGRVQGSSDIPLDEEGVRMAECVAGRLGQEQWDVIFTSPMKRARQTAELISRKMPGIPLIEDERLRENSGGQIEGTTEAERLERWGPSWRTLDLGGEKEADVVERGLAFVREIEEQYAGKKVLAVSHGGFIKRLLMRLVPDLDVSHGFENTSLSIVHLEEGQYRCSLYNCTVHLEEGKL